MKLQVVAARVALLFFVILLSGCGSDRAPTWPARGTVVFADGSPVRTGVVEFESKTHELTATGKISPDGSFVLGTYESDDGAVGGFHRVIVVQFVIRDGTINHTMDHGKPVDPKYASYDTSGLTTTVVPNEENVLQLEVTPAGKK